MLRPPPPLLPLLGSAYLLAWNTWVRALQGDYRGTTSLQPHNVIFELHPVSKPRPLTAEWTHTHYCHLQKISSDLFCNYQIWRSQPRPLHSHWITREFATTGWHPCPPLWMMTSWPRSTTWTKVRQFEVPAKLIPAQCDFTSLSVQWWCCTTTRPPGPTT